MKKIVLLITITLSLFSIQAQAKVTIEKFTEARFLELQKNDAAVLVNVFATWCPTCAKQKIILEDYAEKRPNTDLTILKIDYDDQKEWREKFKAPRQSTFFLFKGEERLWYSVAEKNKKVIFEELDKALGVAGK